MLCNTEILCEMYCTQSLIILNRMAHVFYLCVLYIFIVYILCIILYVYVSGETNKILNLESSISQFLENSVDTVCTVELKFTIFLMFSCCYQHS